MRLISSAVILAVLSAVSTAQADVQLEVDRCLCYESELKISDIITRLAGGVTVGASLKEVTDVLNDEALKRAEDLKARLATRFADGYSEEAVAETFHSLGDFAGTLVARMIQVRFTRRLEIDGQEVPLDIGNLLRANWAAHNLISNTDRSRTIGYGYGFTVRNVRVSRSNYASDGEVVLTADLAGRLGTTRSRVGPVTATAHLDGARLHLVAKESDGKTWITMTATARLTLQLCYGSRSCLVNKLVAKVAPRRASTEADKIAGARLSRILLHLLQVGRNLAKDGDKSLLVLVHTFYQETIKRGLQWE